MAFLKLGVSCLLSKKKNNKQSVQGIKGRLENLGLGFLNRLSR